MTTKEEWNLLENERVDDLQRNGLKIIQKTDGFCFGMTAVVFTGICLYTVPELEQTFSLIRLLFLIIAISLVSTFSIFILHNDALRFGKLESY